MKKQNLCIKLPTTILVVSMFIITPSLLVPNSSAGNEVIFIRINFAGNLDASGGPYWLPPGETIRLYDEGYFTNGARLETEYIHIIVTARSSAGEIVNVFLKWCDLTDDEWDDTLYTFTDIGNDVWEFNSTDVIIVESGHAYSFNILAEDSEGNQKEIEWTKTALDDQIVRRYVRLDCTPANITYRPFFLREISRFIGDKNKEDRLLKDQGTNGWSYDVGTLENDLPSYYRNIEKRYCTMVNSYWFNADICPESFTLENVYFHYWYSSKGNDLQKVGVKKSRGYASLNGMTEFYGPPNSAQSHSDTRLWLGSVVGIRDYYLETHVLEIDSINITDNNIYELSIAFQDNVGNGSYVVTICSQHFPSFVIFNIPDNETLQILDSDNDNINDFDELFEIHTNPFDEDTDNDGLTDYAEVVGEPGWMYDPNRPAVLFPIPFSFNPYEGFSYR